MAATREETPLTGRFRAVVLDGPDIAGLAAFYQALAGWTELHAEDDWITLNTSDGYRIAMQLAPDHVPPRWPDQACPQQFHLDLRVPDIDQAAAQAEKLGAARLGGGETWHTLADPAGHPFDLCLNADDPPYSIFAVTIDCPDAKALAQFYSELLGVPMLYDGAEGALIGAEDQGQLMFQNVENYNPPQWPDPAHPQQVHLDVEVTDIDAAESKALELGATRLPGGGNDEVAASGSTQTRPGTRSASAGSGRTCAAPGHGDGAAGDQVHPWSWRARGVGPAAAGCRSNVPCFTPSMKEAQA